MRLVSIIYMKWLIYVGIPPNKKSRIIHITKYKGWQKGLKCI